MPQLRYGIAGYGDYAETVQTMIKDQGLENQVGWIGPFAHADVGLWIQDADIGIILLENLSRGLYQALPCKLFEYVHATVPVIASNFPEMKSYIESTGVGITVDSGNLDEVEAGLMKMINDKTFYTACKNACRIEREKTNWETESVEYCKFLDIESV
jgi:glycosyltransferase involved in cell wall biosynthesis